MATHYTTLGVAPGASAGDIRRAYHDAARRWHPDRFVDRNDAEARRADVEMKRVNEAWSILGDEARRASYDRELARAANGASTVGGAIRRDADGVGRIDPRLLDPDFLAARRRAVDDEVEVRHSSAIRVITVLGFFGLLLAIFVFTAYANRPADPAAPVRAPGPDIGVDAGACVRQTSEGGLLEVPCSGNSDGRVIGARLPDGSCPPFTVREILLPSGVVVCLGQ